jgi:hypothetical protein
MPSVYRCFLHGFIAVAALKVEIVRVRSWCFHNLHGIGPWPH